MPAEGARGAALAALVGATPVLRRPALVGVDGVDGSGKTTFAARLVARYAAAGRTAHVVHLDDFLNPRWVRYARGRDSSEGFFRDSYDLAAFRERVLEPLAHDAPARVVTKVFDHVRDRRAVTAPTTVGPDDVVVVEGMFLHRDELLARWDVSVFLDVPFEVSVARLARTPPTRRCSGTSRGSGPTSRPADRGKLRRSWSTTDEGWAVEGLALTCVEHMFVKCRRSPVALSSWRT